MEGWIATLMVAVALALVASWFLWPSGWARLLLWGGRKAAGMRSCEIEVNDVRWHYLEGGEGPVLVMVHGFGATADHWLRLAWRLRRQFRVIAPDLVGFGSSDPGTGLGFDVENQAARLEDLLDALDVEQCLLTGSSMGGWIVTAYAAANPSRARALWLQAPLGVADCTPSPFLAEAARRGGLPALESRQDYETHIVGAMFTRQPWIPRPLKAHYAHDAMRRIDAAQEIFRQVRSRSTPLEELAETVAIPVLLQWGEADRVVDVSGAHALGEAFADVEIRLQPEVGHLPMLETPRESLRLFDEFQHHRGLAPGNKA